MAEISTSVPAGLQPVPAPPVRCAVWACSCSPGEVCGMGLAWVCPGVGVVCCCVGLWCRALRVSGLQLLLLFLLLPVYLPLVISPVMVLPAPAAAFPDRPLHGCLLALPPPLCRAGQ